MSVKEFLISEYGFSEEKADEILKTSRMRDVDLVESKLKDMFGFLEFSKEEQKNTISRWPQTLNLSTLNVKQKAEFYKRNFGLSENQFKNMLKVNFSPAHASINKVLDLQEYYLRNWGMTKGQFVAKMKHTPGFIGLSPESVDKKTTAIGLMYDMRYDQLEKLIKSGTNYPAISLDKITEMADFYDEEFGVSPKDFGRMLVSGKPISYTKEKIMSSYDELNAKFNISKTQFGNMMRACPTIIGISPEALVRRIDKFQEIGFELDDIIDNARALTVNSNKIKARYVMARVNGVNDKKFLSSGFMYDDRKMYSRMVYLHQNGFKKQNVYIPEKKFEKYAGVKTDDIVLKDIDMAAVEQEMLEIYNKRHQTNLEFSPEELNND